MWYDVIWPIDSRNTITRKGRLAVIFLSNMFPKTLKMNSHVKFLLKTSILTYIATIWHILFLITHRQLFSALCYTFERSSACDWLFLFNTLHSPSLPWKRAKCSQRQSKISQFFPGDHAPKTHYKFVSSLPTHKKSWLRAWLTIIILWSIVIDSNQQYSIFIINNQQ